MKKLLLATLVIAAFAFACKKNSSPRKVDRIILSNTWRIEKMIDNEVNYSEDFENYTFNFAKENELIITMPDSTFSGTWDRQERKNPAVLIINTPVNGPTKLVGDDWNIVFLTKDEFRLERLNSKLDPADELIFRKI